MFTLDSLTTFLGWCTLLTFGLLILSIVLLLVLKDWISSLHSRWFGIDSKALPLVYFNFLGNLKLLWYVFNLIPYIALKLMI